MKTITRKIAAVRVRNNLLWIAVLDLALEIAPKQTKIILRKIDMNDRRISQLIKKLGK